MQSTDRPVCEDLGFVSTLTIGKTSVVRARVHARIFIESRYILTVLAPCVLTRRYGVSTTLGQSDLQENDHVRALLAQAHIEIRQLTLVDFMAHLSWYATQY